MSQWHANIDQSTLATGAHLTVLSEHKVVRVVRADTLSIETPTGERFSALVLERYEGDLTLVLDDGSSVRLDIFLDESLLPSASRATFSSQTWLTH